MCVCVFDGTTFYVAKRIPEQVTISTVWCECEICVRASFGWTDMWREGEAGVVEMML